MGKQYARISALLIGAAALCGVGTASAQTITLNPLNPSVTLGSNIVVDIIGTDFTGGTSGGGIDLSWDPGILSLSNVDTTPFPLDKTFGQDGVLDSVAGTLRDLSVSSLGTTAATSFTVATLTFQTVGTGLSPLNLELGSFAQPGFDVWTDANGAQVNPTFADGSATVSPSAIPLPAAVWLFGTGLAGLFGVARRKDPVDA